MNELATVASESSRTYPSSRGLPRIALLLLVGIAASAIACRPATKPDAMTPEVEREAARIDAAGEKQLERQHALATMSRIGVIGASVSAGFHSDTPLALALDRTVEFDHEIFAAASAAFFTAPKPLSVLAAGEINRWQPTALIAMDFLFWFAYGSKSLDERIADLRIGLGVLDKLACPMWVGDIPDMRSASPRMLPRRWIPPREQFAPLNRVIHEWAGRRPRVHLLPLAEWTTRLRNGEALELDGEQVYSDPHGVFSWDMLHPNRRGMIILGQLICQELVRTLPGLERGDFAFDAERVYERLAQPSDKKTATRTAESHD